ncbi:hypothetical protein THRCLA_21814 [Thraustotheca clavata]|uniref:Uncharacterized protein n=1 Tax=Thraustotheca clavata TaxID=74557 RepID=A0A1V9ZNL9_9STRA|nr:hypothetical protein THRCLA_21814 [Thraustotheca clavata]
MSSHLAKLNSILDDFSLTPSSSPAGERERGILCEFTVVQNPSFMEKLNWNSSVKKSTTRLYVRMDNGTISIGSVGHIPKQLSSGPFTVIRQGKKDIRLSSINSAIEHTFIFSNAINAIECHAAVHLIQHINYLQNPDNFPQTVYEDKMFSEQLEATLSYAQDMWQLALWHQLWPYSHLLEYLTTASSLLQTPNNLHQIHAHLSEIYDEFYPHAMIYAIDNIPSKENVKFYRASYVALLVAKLKALLTHIEYYITLAP